jgi:hypothetical protein
VVWDAKVINPPFTPTLGGQLGTLTKAYKNKAITEEGYPSRPSRRYVEEGV